MKLRIWVAAGVLAALAIHHCQATGEPVAPSPTTRASLAALIAQLPTPAHLRHHAFYVETGTLGFTGVAKDDEGTPIAGATIVLGPRATTSADDGTFAFSHLGPGTYLVTGEKADAFGQDTVALADGDEASVALELRVGPTLHLRVVAKDGTPVPDASVELSGLASAGAITDPTGSVVMRGLDTDSVFAVIGAAGHPTLRARIEMGDDPHGSIERTLVLADGAELAGSVVDEHDQPVADASVSLQLGDWREAVQADATGHWHVAFVPAGTLAATASGDAFCETADLLVEHDGMTPKRDVTIHVVRGATARGVVVDEAGAPVADVAVILGRSTGRSDPHGHFEITGIQPGLAELYAYTAALASVPRKYEVALGRALELRVVMIASSISGVVVDPHGAPVANASVVARCKGDDCSGGGYASSDATGKFDLGGLPPGMYDVAVQRDKDRAPYPDGHPVRAGTHGLRLVVAALGGVTGHVTLRGSAVAYYGVIAALEPEPRLGGGPQAVHAQDGTFALAHLAPGLYTLELAGPTFETKRVEHVRVSDGDVIDIGDVAVEPGRVIRGRVTDERGAPIANAVVMLASRGPWRGDTTLAGMAAGTRVAHSASDGSYELAGITGDDLYLEASYEDQRAQPHLLASGDQVVDLVVVRTGTVVGHVDHMRAHDGRVYLTSLADHTYVATDPDLGGDFRLAHVPPGDYAVALVGVLTMLPQEVHVDGGATSIVTIALAADPITVVVHATCEIMQLRTGDEYLTSKTCADGAATFEDVMPGPYRVCTRSARCVELSVTAGPPHQEVTPHFPDPPARPDPPAPEAEAGDPSAP